MHGARVIAIQPSTESQRSVSYVGNFGPIASVMSERLARVARQGCIKPRDIPHPELRAAEALLEKALQGVTSRRPTDIETESYDAVLRAMDWDLRNHKRNAAQLRRMIQELRFMRYPRSVKPQEREVLIARQNFFWNLLGVFLDVPDEKRNRLGSVPIPE